MRIEGLGGAGYPDKRSSRVSLGSADERRPVIVHRYFVLTVPALVFDVGGLVGHGYLRLGRGGGGGAGRRGGGGGGGGGRRARAAAAAFSAACCAATALSAAAWAAASFSA